MDFPHRLFSESAPRPWSVWGIAILFVLGTEGYAFNVYPLGGEEGNPWPTALSYQPGGYVILGPAGQVASRRSIATPSTHATWQETLTVWIDSVGGQWLRPFFVSDTLNLARDGVRERIPRGLFDNLATSDYCGVQSSGVRKIRPMFDGDPNTTAFFLATPSEDRKSRLGIYVQNAIVDLGADYPINRVRFFPRLGTDHPEIDEMLARMNPPRLRQEELAAEDFSLNSLPWFEVAGASSRVHFPESCGSETPENPWFQRISPYKENIRSGNDSRFTILQEVTENLNVVVDFRFPRQPLQWVTVRPLYPIRNWEIAEFQVFGQGYVYRALYRSAVLDFGTPVVLGKIRWQGDVEEDAQVLIRTRSGTDAEPNRYLAPTVIPGTYKEIPREEYERLPASERRLELDAEHWSFWSGPYPWEAGMRNPSLPGATWQDGTPILSPGPARYFQFQILFLSTPEAAGRLQALEIQFSEPAAQEVVGEIWPLDVSRTESTTFTYSVLPTLSDGDLGFDRLEIFTLTRADTVRSVRVDRQEMIHQYPPQIQEDRMVVHFPRLQGAGDTATPIEVVFDAHVVLYGMEFKGWIYDSEGSGVKQLIRPGDASFEYPGDVLGVRTDALGASALTPVVVYPNPFTPNGDGVNDIARFYFQVHEVTVPRPLSLCIYDMAGQPVRTFATRRVRHSLFGAGAGDLSWDGRDDASRRVTPGLYLYRVSLEGDKGREERVGTIAVVY